MTKLKFKAITLLLVLFSFLFGTYSVAGDSSVGPVSFLDVVKGTVLLKIKNEELLNNNLRQIFTGKDGLKKNKLIRVEGVNDGNEIMLQGTGSNGEGYEFTLSTSSGSCGVSPIIPGKVIRETIPFPYPFSIGFESTSSEIEPDVNTNDKYKCRGANGKATLKANFQETENGSSIVGGKFNLRFRSSAGLPDPGSDECAPFPTPDSTDTNDSDEKYIEEPEVINVKLENIPSSNQLGDPNALLAITVKVQVDTEILGLKALTGTPDYRADALGITFTDTGEIDTTTITIIILSEKIRLFQGVQVLVGLPSCITFSLITLGGMAGNSPVIVKEILDPTPIDGVKITQSDEAVLVTCKDPNNCE